MSPAVSSLALVFWKILRQTYGSGLKARNTSNRARSCRTLITRTSSSTSLQNIWRRYDERHHNHRDVPRLSAFGFWCVPLGGILLHFSVLAGGAPAVGWFAYAPLSETPYSSNLGVDYWAIAIIVMGIGSIILAINIIATVISCRAPGMTMRRLPLFTWINFINAFII